jgi:hypothetical protein
MYLVKTNNNYAEIYDSEMPVSLLTVWSAVANEKFGSAEKLAQDIADHLNSKGILNSEVIVTDPCCFCLKYPCGINNHCHPDCNFEGHITKEASSD